MIDTLPWALARAQAEYRPCKRTRKSHHGKYAPLDEVLASITPALSKHGLARWWETQTVTTEKGLFIRVTAFIGDGDGFLSSSIEWPMLSKAQDLGAVITYLRRYTMQAVAGVAPDEDTDGPQDEPKPEGGRLK